MKSAALMLLFVVFAGCANTQTPAQKVFAAHQVYEGALTAAVAYRKLPDCAKSDTPVCSDKEVVATVQKADIAAFEALKSAQNVVRSSKSKSALDTAVKWAQEAVNGFSRIVNGLNVSGQR